MNINELKNELLKLRLVNWKSLVAVETPNKIQWAVVKTRWDVATQTFIIEVE
jgi:hypothetical protein